MSTSLPFSLACNILLVVTVIGLPQISRGDDLELRDYQELARKSLRDKWVEFAPPSVNTIDGHILFAPAHIYFNPVNNNLENHFMNEVLEVEIMRLMCTRAKDNGGLNSAFWEPTLTYIDLLIAADIEEGKRAQTTAQRNKIIENARPVHMFLFDKLLSYSRQNNLDPPGLTLPAPFIPVIIKTEYEGLSIHRMHIIEWEIAVRRGQNPTRSMSHLIVTENARQPLETGEFVILMKQNGRAVSRPTRVTIPVCRELTFYADGHITAR